MAYHSIAPIRTESVSAVTATNTVELGTRVWDSGREYCYIYNGGAELAKDLLCVMTGTSGYTVAVTFATTITTAASPLVFGVARNGTIAAGSYGWVLTRGHCDLVSDGTYVITAGDMLMPSGSGLVRPMSAVSVLTAAVYMIHGNKLHACTATTAGSTVTLSAYVRLG